MRCIKIGFTSICFRNIFLWVLPFFLIKRAEKSRKSQPRPTLLAILPSDFQGQRAFFDGLWLFAGLVLLTSCQNIPSEESGGSFFSAAHTSIQYTGRFESIEGEAMRFGWSGSQIMARFEGPMLRIRLKNESIGKDRMDQPHRSFYQVRIDDDVQILEATNGQGEYLLADSLSEGPHTFRLFKRTEASTGIGIFEGLELAKGKKLLPLQQGSDRQIEFIGNSITCGYGNEGDRRDCPFTPATENAWMSYASITARKLDAEHSMISYSGRGVVQNYDKSREGTLPQIWKRNYPQSEKTYKSNTWQPDLVIINLGTNDFAHENPVEDDFVGTYTSFLQEIRRAYPACKILCLTGPMMTDGNARKPLSTLKAYLTKAIEQSGLEEVYRFDLTTQGPLGYGCDWHPNVAQHVLNAEELAGYIGDMMGWARDYTLQRSPFGTGRGAGRKSLASGLVFVFRFYFV